MAGLPAGSRLVLPSPNGSTISTIAAEYGRRLFAACLRNAAAVAGAITRAGAGRVAVIASGERWRDGSLRPALEDLLGAGAVVHALGPSDRSPDAEVAAAAFEHAALDIRRLLFECPSGQELIDHGYPQDVAIAAELDVSASAPAYVDGAFVRGA
jgi:2-phosphosulfolactate phosphatase